MNALRRQVAEMTRREDRVKLLLDIDQVLSVEDVAEVQANARRSEG